jgi:pimeloyl-ACP methyl ester carboxylesterase
MSNLFALTSVLVLLIPGRAAACQSFFVPVTVAGVANAQIYGELCLPDGPPPATVQLLVHTTGANHHYWDPPMARYSYVRAAVAAGYATFNIDRLGTGLSTKPSPATVVSIESVTDTLDQVIGALRSGALGVAFRKVIWVGSSYGSGYGWAEAARHPGSVDGFILTSLLHYTKPSFMMNLALPAIAPACTDPVFAHLGLDCDYISTARGSIGPIYFYPLAVAPGVEPNGVWDAIIRDVVSLPLLVQSLATLGGILSLQPPMVFTPMPVATDYARAITVPALIVVGDHDNIFCGPPDGLPCDAGSLLAFESPYYGTTPDLYVAKDSGHAFVLQLSAPDAFQAMLAWADARVGAH